MNQSFPFTLNPIIHFSSYRFYISNLIMNWDGASSGLASKSRDKGKSKFQNCY